MKGFLSRLRMEEKEGKWEIFYTGGKQVVRIRSEPSFIVHQSSRVRHVVSGSLSQSVALSLVRDCLALGCLSGTSSKVQKAFLLFRFLFGRIETRRENSSTLP